MRRALALLATTLVGVSAAVGYLMWSGTLPGPIKSGVVWWGKASRRDTPGAVLKHPFPAGYQFRHRGSVDASTGLYVREDEDLALREPMPFMLTRTYLSRYRVSRQFGVGTTNNAEWYLIGDPKDFAWSELILANGARVRFNRTSQGTSYDNAVYANPGSPLALFSGAQLGWAGDHWLMRFADGGFARFLPCGGSASACSIVQLRDPDDHVIDFERDGSGLLQTIRGADERIEFHYDSQRRVTHARHNGGHSVDYAYDDRGRLVRVRESDGKTRQYSYSDKDELLTIDEPGWVITNTFDGAGRVVHQKTQITEPGADMGREYSIAFDYKTHADRITETTVTEYDGTSTINRYDDDGHERMEILDARGASPITVTYERHPVARYPTGIRVYCTVKGRRVVGSAQIVADRRATKDRLIVETCETALSARQF